MGEEGPKKTPFEDFLLGEYTNLAQAFFSAATGITQFFQYYLLALGVPLTAAGVAIRVSSGTLKLEEVVKSSVATPLGWFFIIVGFVGVCMAIYIMNLRLDALLYARAVNGLRNYFYQKSAIPTEEQRRFRLLPADMSQPAYFEPTFFLPVVLAFGLLNSAYFCLGLLIFGHSSTSAMTVTFVSSLVGHVAIYAGLAVRRNSYLSASQSRTLATVTNRERRSEGDVDLER